LDNSWFFPCCFFVSTAALGLGSGTLCVDKMGGKGKGGARAAWLPPARSRGGGEGDTGLSITDKIKARRAAGGAESWDEYKARLAKKQGEEHALENWDLVMSAQHREVLDRERDARLAAARGGGGDSTGHSSKRHKSDKDHKKHKHKDKEHKKHKHKDKHKERDKEKRKKRERRDDDSSSESDDAAGGAPVPLSKFLAEADSDDSDDRRR